MSRSDGVTRCIGGSCRNDMESATSVQQRRHGHDGRRSRARTGYHPALRLRRMPYDSGHSRGRRSGRRPAERYQTPRLCRRRPHQLAGQFGTMDRFAASIFAPIGDASNRNFGSRSTGCCGLSLFAMRGHGCGVSRKGRELM